MKTKLLLLLTAIALVIPNINNAQINLGTAANFVLFSTNGPLSNTGTSPLTGDIGTNNGASTNFNNVTGTIHDMDGTSANCATDLLAAYNQLNLMTATLIPVTTLGNGQIITAGTYSLSAASTINNTLTLNGQSNANSVFVIQVKGSLSTAAGAVVLLTNGALACNVYWTVEGVVSLGAGTVMKGTVIANNAAINIYSGVLLEGRALTTAGAVGINNTTASLPTGCTTGTSTTATTINSQPTSQTVCPGTSLSFSVTAGGASLTYQWRKGTVNLVNGGNISGATSPVLVINPVSSTDIASDYNVIVTGSNGTVTSANAALATSIAPLITVSPANQVACPDYRVTFSVAATGTGLTYQWRKGSVNMVNGGNISGATTSILAIDPMMTTDVSMDYNVIITGVCGLTDTSANASLKLCGPVGIIGFNDIKNNVVSFYPNPFSSNLNVILNDASQANSQLSIYNILGKMIMQVPVSKKVTEISTSQLPAGVYFYNFTVNDKVIQSGKLVSQQ